jgi:hypothetical protein
VITADEFVNVAVADDRSVVGTVSPVFDPSRQPVLKVIVPNDPPLMTRTVHWLSFAGGAMVDAPPLIKSCPGLLPQFSVVVPLATTP